MWQLMTSSVGHSNECFVDPSAPREGADLWNCASIDEVALRALAQATSHSTALSQAVPRHVFSLRRSPHSVCCHDRPQPAGPGAWRRGTSIRDSSTADRDIEQADSSNSV